MVTVVCWRWGKKYPASHVARLQSMLKRHLTIPHQLVCLTDKPKELPKGVMAAALPKPPKGDNKCLRRMWLYSQDAERLGDRLFQIDLDVVITANIDNIVGRTEPFVIWKGDSNTIHKWAYNATVMLLNAGAKRYVWDRFIANPVGVMAAADKDGWWAKVNSDQAAATFLLKDDPDVATFTQADGIYAYRVFAGKHGERGAVLPDDARIVSFHGPRDPSVPDLQLKSPWIREHWR
jgi:hypothetical protein